MKKMNLTSANMAFMSWSEITGMHFISWNKEKLGPVARWDEMRTKSRPWLTPGSSESPSLCRWECLSHKGACYLDCLSLKIPSSNNVRNVIHCYVLDKSRTKLVVWRAASVHEGLCDDAEARVDDVGLPKVEHEVRVLDQIHPEPARSGTQALK